MNKIIRYIFLLILAYILLIVFISNNSIYLTFREAPIISNLLVGVVLIFPGILLLRKINKEISNKTYKKILIVLSIITFILQIIILKFTYFYTDWDVKALRDIIINNDLYHNYYLTKYPNNLFYLAILTLYNHIPIISNYYFPLLMFNALLVNITGVITSLTIKRFTDNTRAIIGYLILLPLILLSPWINIPYSDTFAIMFPILIIYLYTKEDKKAIDYFFIGFLTILGYFIKPTVFIAFIAVLLIEILKIIKKETKINIKRIGIVIIGLLSAFIFCKGSIYLLHFKPYPHTNSFGPIHYLAMGQNNNSYGLFNEQDVAASDKYGRMYDLNKAIKRIKERNLKEHFTFLEVKTLINFNDGTFAWGREGEKFYYKILSDNSRLSMFLRNYFYKDWKYNYIFKELMQIIWLLVLSLSFLSGLKDKDNKNTIIYLSLIGIVLFLTIFEARARYLYCYSPIFIVAAMIGLNNIKKMTKTVKKRK